MQSHNMSKSVRSIGALSALLVLHAISLAGVICGVYFSLMLGHWWPVSLALAIVVAFDVALLVRRLRSPRHTFQLQHLEGKSPSASR